MRARQIPCLLLALLFLTSGIAALPASAATPQTLITCTDTSSGKTVIVKSMRRDCRTYSGKAIWQSSQAGSNITTGAAVEYLNTCTSKNSIFNYEIIKLKCSSYQFPHQYLREVKVPATPAIQSISPRGDYGIAISLDASNNQSLIASPISYYRVTNLVTNQVSYVVPDKSGRILLDGLSTLTPYTFKIAAINVDGISQESEKSSEITLPAVIISKPVVTAPVYLSVGDRGPGGGIVFYVSQNAFTSAGSTCNTNCHYLEVAPSTWQSGVVAEDGIYIWSDNSILLTGQDTITASVEGRLADRAKEKANWRIGAGFHNTNVMKVAGAQSPAQAAVLAYAASDASAGQWFIPSTNELNELCKFARGQATGDLAIACSSEGYINNSTTFGADAGGFAEGIYWSSTERDVSRTWLLNLSGRYGSQSAFKDSEIYIRPIRAF
jgi:hypothetical protein